MNLTEAQYQAVYTHDQNLIVVAGAGSGKTRVLVERYMALLDANPDWPLNALVAITFTRKAAQEMRDRVRQALETRLAGTAGIDQKLWAKRLASMDSARIDTIHGLCATILRANAAEAGLDPDFAVLDEVEAAVLLDSAIEDALQSMAESQDPALQLFAEYDSASIQQILRDFIGIEVAAAPDNLMTQWQQAWAESAAYHVAQLCENELFRAALAWEPGCPWPEDDRLGKVWQHVFDHYDAVLDPDGLLASRLDVLQVLCGGIDLRGGSAAHWGDKEGLQAAKDQLRSIRELGNFCLDSIGDSPGPLDVRAAQLIPLWTRLIWQAQSSYAQAKSRESLLDFDDLETQTLAILENVPQVRQRYRMAEFKHLLVDEFQDTNARQWRIVQALADPQQPGSLFVVGDQKQSIYAFRGADVSVFGEVRQHLGSVGLEIALNRSFRSHQPLIAAFNACFAHILQREPGGLVERYQTDLDVPLEAERSEPPTAAPTLEFLLLNSDLADGDSEDKRRWEAYIIGERLKAMVDAETPVYDHGTGIRPMRYDDVALLFQSTRNIVLYETVFKALDLPFVTVAGRGYYNRQEVWDLLNLLKALYNPADNLSLAAALRSPLFGLSDDALLALRLLRDPDDHVLLLWQALNQSQVVPGDEVALVDFARDCLYELAALAGRVTISELLREALRQTGYLATLTGLPDGARRRGNVEKLLGLAESSGRISLGAFEQFLSDLSTREVREGEAAMDVGGVMTLMSVHASKGLEYPVIVLVDTSWTRGTRGGNPVIYDGDFGLCCKVYDPDEDKYSPSFSYRQANHLAELREEAERRRLLYVAATRAQDYLLVSGQVKQNKEGLWQGRGWLGWLLDALSLQSELPESGVNLIERDWGQMRVQMEIAPPAPDNYAVTDAASAWDKATQPFMTGASCPPLFQAVPLDRSVLARHLSATQIADLGAKEIAAYYGQRFQRQVWQDAPARIGPVETSRARRRLIGEIVHQALHWWQPADGHVALDQLLSSLTWEQGIVDTLEQAAAIQEAESLLAQFYRSEIYRWIEESGTIYRELPFIFENGAHIIHGVIDILLQRPDGQWVIIDYKTDYLHEASQSAAEIHAQRYTMQVACYAEAVLEQLGAAARLKVYIHYVRHGFTVEIAAAQWREALAMMEPFIGSLAGN